MVATNCFPYRVIVGDIVIAVVIAVVVTVVGINCWLGATLSSLDL